MRNSNLALLYTQPMTENRRYESVPFFVRDHQKMICIINHEREREDYDLGSLKIKVVMLAPRDIVVMITIVFKNGGGRGREGEILSQGTKQNV